MGNFITCEGFFPTQMPPGICPGSFLEQLRKPKRQDLPVASVTLAGKDHSLNSPLGCRRERRGDGSVPAAQYKTWAHLTANAHGLLSGPVSVQPLTASSESCPGQGKPSALDILGFTPLTWGQHQQQDTDANWGTLLGLPSKITATRRGPQISQSN